MDELILAEYNNLFHEKLSHAAELKKFQSYLNYLIPTGSVAFAVGLARLDETVLAAASNTAEVGFLDFIALLVFPLCLALPLVATFMTTEMYQVHVISRCIKSIEERFAAMYQPRPMAWESAIVQPVYYYDKKVHGEENKLKNPIRWSGVMTGILGVAIFFACVATGTMYLWKSDLHIPALIFLALTFVVGGIAGYTTYFNLRYQEIDSVVEKRVRALYREATDWHDPDIPDDSGCGAAPSDPEGP